jgi:hypothetical protein
MILCVRCDHTVVGSGAFLPDPDPGFACLDCYRAVTGETPLPPALFNEARLLRNAPETEEEGKRRPNHKKVVRYIVSVTRPTGNVSHVTSKKNVLTFPNLPPGSYSATARRRGP